MKAKKKGAKVARGRGAHRKAAHGEKHGTSRKTPRPSPRTSKKRHHHRCGLCNHAAAHIRGQGCLHFDGKRFCTCKHRA